MIVYANGDYLPGEEARISPLDRGILHGIGAFETLRSYGGAAFMLDAHVRRLRDALRTLRIPPPDDLDDLESILSRLLALNGLRDARLRVTVTAGSESPTILCTAEELPPYGDELYEEGASAIIIDEPERYEHRFSRIKSTSYLGNTLAREEARRRGALEAILCHPLHGPIECSMSNLFMVERGGILTPPLSLPILPGITRDFVLTIAGGLKLPVAEIAFTKDRLLESDEVFITNSLMEVMPLVRIDGRNVGNGKPGDISLRILKAYRKIARDTSKKEVL